MNMALIPLFVVLILEITVLVKGEAGDDPDQCMDYSGVGWSALDLVLFQWELGCPVDPLASNDSLVIIEPLPVCREVLVFQGEVPLVGVCAERLSRSVNSLCHGHDGISHILEKIPVADKSSTNYVNIFCGHCNDVEDMDFWRNKAKCDSHRLLGAIFKNMNNLNAMLEHTETYCTLVENEPRDDTLERCAENEEEEEDFDWGSKIVPAEPMVQNKTDNLSNHQQQTSGNAERELILREHLSNMGKGIVQEIIDRISNNDKVQLSNIFNDSILHSNYSGDITRRVREAYGVRIIHLIESLRVDFRRRSKYNVNKTSIDSYRKFLLERFDKYINDTPLMEQLDPFNYHWLLESALYDASGTLISTGTAAPQVSAFTILVNFGFDGNSHMLFTMEASATKGSCSEGEVYDAYQDVCRVLIPCKGEQCQSEVDDTWTTLCNESQVAGAGCLAPYLDASVVAKNRADIMSSSVLNVTFQVEMEPEMFPHIYKPESEMYINMTTKLTKAIADELKIPLHTVDNMTLTFVSLVNAVLCYFSNAVLPNSTECMIHVNVAFQIHNKGLVIDQEGFRGVTDFLRAVSNEGNVQVNSGFGVVNITSLVDVSGNIASHNTDWCMNGKKVLYVYPDFHVYELTHDNGSKEMILKVEETEKNYTIGEFEMTIALQPKSNGGFNTEGHAIVCNHPLPLTPLNCARVQLGSHEYEFLPNGSVLYSGHVFDYYTRMPEGEVQVCLSPHMKRNGSLHMEYNFVCEGVVEVGIALRYLTVILGTLSLLCLFLTLITYAVLRPLRNRAGFNLANLSLALFLSQLLFLLFGGGNLVGVVACKAIAVFLHFLFLVTFFWMNVIAFDLHWNFSKGKITLIGEANKFTPFYFCYGWGAPLLIVGICAILDFVASIDIVSMNYGTSIGEEAAAQISGGNYSLNADSSKRICWINNPRAALASFGVPVMMIFFINIGLFTHTLIGLRSVSAPCQSVSNPQRQVRLYLRMSTLMGFTWIFGLLSAFISAVTKPCPVVCYSLLAMSGTFTVLSGSQGIFIFIAFIVNRRILDQYKNQYTEWRTSTRKKSLASASSIISGQSMK